MSIGARQGAGEAVPTCQLSIGLETIGTYRGFDIALTGHINHFPDIRSDSPYARELRQARRKSRNCNAVAPTERLAQLLQRQDRFLCGPLSLRVEVGHVVAAAPGHGPGLHTHPFWEITSVLEGQARFQVGELACDFGPGDCFVNAPNHLHQWTNGDNPSRFLGLMVSIMPQDGDTASCYADLHHCCKEVAHRLQADAITRQALFSFVDMLFLPEADIDSIIPGLHLLLAQLLRQLQIDHVRAQSATAPDSTPLRQAMSFINTFFSRDIGVDDVAREVGLSARHLNRLFHRAGLDSLQQELQRIRLGHAEELLHNHKLSIATIAKSCGYRDGSYFARVYRRAFGRSPTAMRQELGNIV